MLNFRGVITIPLGRSLVTMTLPSAMCWSDAPKLFPHLQGYCQNFRSPKKWKPWEIGPTFLLGIGSWKKNLRQSIEILVFCFLKILLTLGCTQPLAPEFWKVMCEHILWFFTWCPGEYSIYTLQTGLQYGLAGTSRSSSWCPFPRISEGDSWPTAGPATSRGPKNRWFLGRKLGS